MKTFLNAGSGSGFCKTLTVPTTRDANHQKLNSGGARGMPPENPNSTEMASGWTRMGLIRSVILKTPNGNLINTAIQNQDEDSETAGQVLETEYEQEPEAEEESGPIHPALDLEEPNPYVVTEVEQGTTGSGGEQRGE
ncbi:hypothetical protein OUZ56_008795 [Daphnia magna]|uniref:Uncharacterized protein n=1 Tax=Daphnia magna TaxID=35525 RepID=A0ABR0AEB2_9CRUS|nr:hypothetical protein OUZ56_008795 [Daphnia magna]